MHNPHLCGLQATYLNHVLCCSDQPIGKSFYIVVKAEFIWICVWEVFILGEPSEVEKNESFTLLLFTMSE